MRSKVTDLRGKEKDFSLDTAGFKILHHKSLLSSFTSVEEIEVYRSETEACLEKEFEADRVFCFDVKLRLNRRPDNILMDLRDKTLMDIPAQGAHNDVSFGSGPTLIDYHLPDELKERYLKPGYRFRIVNTWRSILPVIEDSPLALCDFRSVDKNDLISCDRVIPTRAGEVYYLKYNPAQQWYWLDHMTPEEPFLFVVYDSAPGDQARYCPHAPIKDNPLSPPSAPPRRSVETRSIIITKIGPTELSFVNKN